MITATYVLELVGVLGIPAGFVLLLAAAGRR